MTNRYGVHDRMTDTVRVCASRADAETAAEREPRTLRVVVEGDDGIACHPEWPGALHHVHEPGSPVWPAHGQSTGAVRFPREDATERMADLIRGAEAGDPAVAEGLAAGGFACHWTDAEIADLADAADVAGPLDCDAIRALVEALDRREAELDAANREDA